MKNKHKDQKKNKESKISRFKKIKVDPQKVIGCLEIILKIAVAVVIGLICQRLLADDFLSLISFSEINDLHSSYLFSTMNKGKDILVTGGFILTVLYILIYLCQIKLDRKQLIDKIYLAFFTMCLVFFFGYVFVGGTQDSAKICILFGSLEFLQRLPITLIIYVPMLVSFVFTIKNYFTNTHFEFWKR